MTVNGRSQVLSAIRRALGEGASDAVFEPAPLTLSGEGADKTTLAHSFCVELEALGGMAALVRDRSECALAVSRYLQERNIKRVAVQSSFRALDLASRLPMFDAAPALGSSQSELEAVECGLLDGQALLADTGSAIVLLSSREDRLLPYLPRTCVVVSDTSSLHATLTVDALACGNNTVAGQPRGEALIITGPSRTADIEKTLVLGAHGPEAVAVFIMEQL